MPGHVSSLASFRVYSIGMRGVELIPSNGEFVLYHIAEFGKIIQALAEDFEDRRIICFPQSDTAVLLNLAS